MTNVAGRAKQGPARRAGLVRARRSTGRRILPGRGVRDQRRPTLPGADSDATLPGAGSRGPARSGGQRAGGKGAAARCAILLRDCRVPQETAAVVRSGFRRPYRQRLNLDIKALADARRLPPRSWTPDRLWQAYQQLEGSKVRGSGQRVLADVVSLVRFAVGEDDELVPFAEQVKRRFEGWLAMQETAGRSFTSEQRQRLEAMRDHIAGSVSIGLEDFQYAPFDQRGGVARAYNLFGDDLEQVLEELNGELVA